MQDAYLSKDRDSKLWPQKRLVKEGRNLKSKEKRIRNRKRLSRKMGEQACNRELEKKNQDCQKDKFNVHMPDMQEKFIAEKRDKNWEVQAGVTW